MLGTDGYIAPETYLGLASPKSDIFSAGVIMFALVEGRYPYDMSLFDDKPNQNYVGCYKMQEIYDKLYQSEVFFGRSWQHLDEAKAFCEGCGFPVIINVSPVCVGHFLLASPHLEPQAPALVAFGAAYQPRICGNRAWPHEFR